MTSARPFWLAGRPATGEDVLAVRRPYDGSSLGAVWLPTPVQVEEAVAAAAAARAATAALPAYARAAALDHLSDRIGERAAEIAELITAESGKPLRWARIEVTRAVSTFRWAAGEARRFSGELQRLDTDPAAAGRLAVVRRFPYGPVLGITPFNFPLNLVAHKVAPAIAAGAPIVVKPAPATPLSALLLGELLAETELPAGSWSVLPVPNDRMAPLVADPRLPVISFTGSDAVGWQIRAAVPRKHVTLELGGNAAVLVCADADVDFAAGRIATFANYQAGQSCISVQRVLVERPVYEATLAAIVAAVRALRVGDPADERTDVGPLISVAAAQRVAEWVGEAVQAGARVLVGGDPDGSSYPPTVLVETPHDAKVSCREVFGPVLTVEPVESVAEGLMRINDSPYGLQAGVFTRDVTTAFRAHRELEVGGLVIGDVPSYRADQMPYGGVKESGTGREGVRYAMEDYTYPRVMVLTGLDL
ncbi:MAG: aldehyde dehydrogenase family protein [Actinobacteria bacterium]|nr:aldehyde dehydrogenase family protein [Actinomycetota bacterium]MBI3685922.1 aldehyde dehydrogenase family protein [Actinomycetota bacterium]